MGCDAVYPQAVVSVTTVSIHAPAWGATVYIREGMWNRKVSIHAPAWGATYHGA